MSFQNFYSGKKEVTNWALMWLFLWMNRFKMCLQFSYLRIILITYSALMQNFLLMDWFNMLFQIDFCRKIIITAWTCLVKYYPYENNWHVFPKFLFWKNRSHKLSTYVTDLLNEQIIDVLTIFFFEFKPDHR